MQHALDVVVLVLEDPSFEALELLPLLPALLVLVLDPNPRRPRDSPRALLGPRRQTSFLVLLRLRVRSYVHICMLLKFARMGGLWRWYAPTSGLATLNRCGSWGRRKLFKKFNTEGTSPQTHIIT